MRSAIRRRLIPKSVRFRLTFWYLLTLGGALTAVAAFVLIFQVRSLTREFDATLEIRMRELLEELRPVLLTSDLGRRLLQDATASTAPLLVNQDGHILFRSPSFPAVPATGERELRGIRAGRPTLRSLADLNGQAFRFVSVEERQPGTEPLQLHLAASLAPIQQTAGRLIGTFVLFLAIILVVAGYGSNFTATRALAPVDAIIDRVQRIRADHLTARLEVRADTEEIDRLVTMLNEMLDRIDVSMQSARRFAGDVSHELQTPIATLRGTVELGLRRARSLEEYQAMGEGVLAEIDRLSALVKDLRLLALAEAGHLFDRPERVDLASLTEDCAEIGRALGEEKEIGIETVLDGRPVVPGNASHLRRALLNLVQNAIRYSPASSTVAITLGTADGAVTIAVRDSGCGIAPEDLPHVFEPFYRADPARARETGGTGLGLAIADHVVRAHQGRIDVASRPGQGSIFTIHLKPVLDSGTVGGGVE